MPAAELAKKFFRPSREIAGRKPLLRCLVSEKRAEPAAAIALLVKRTGAGERRSFSEQDSTTVPKFAYPLILPLRESCWGVPSPNPALRPAPLIPPPSCGNRKEVNDHAKEIQHAPPQPCGKNPAVR